MASAESLAGTCGQGLVPGGWRGAVGGQQPDGAKGALPCVARGWAEATSGCGKLHEVMMKSRFIMHEGSGGGASRDTGPLFPACNRLREEGSKQDLSPRV